MSCLLSIIVPIYKVELYLERCIKSIANQIYDNIEIILVNDGSPDKCPQICDEWAEKEKRIKVIHKENGGLSDARNVGLEQAIGNYVWFVDSDDWLTDNAINIIVDAIQKYPEVDVLVTQLIKYTNKPEGLFPKEEHYSNCLKILSGKEFIKYGFHLDTAQRFIVKRDILKNYHLNFVKGILHEDNIWVIELIYLVNKLVLIPSPLYIYFQRHNSIMSSIKIKSCYDLIIGHRNLISFMDNYVSLEEKKWFLYICFRNVIWGCLKHLTKFVNTIEYDEFMKKNRNYINSNVLKVFYSLNMKWKFAFILFIIYPKMFLILIRKLYISN